MKLDSKYFDCIRVKPDEDRLRQDEDPLCEWPECRNPARHLAPRGRGREGQYFNFCVAHVREYNKSYNYFNGMSDQDVAAFQKANVTGHRPTWKVNVNGRKKAGEGAGAENRDDSTSGFDFRDPFGLFGSFGFGKSRAEKAPAKPVRNAERKCLKALDLKDSASSAEIKSRFKMLVKRHHPDHNGGDRRSEDQLREVIQAYNYLKEAGFC